MAVRADDADHGSLLGNRNAVFIYSHYPSRKLGLQYCMHHECGLEPGNALQRLRYMQIHSITFLLTSVRIGGALFGTWRCKRLSAPETKRTTYLSRRFKLQVSKIIVALTVAAGFASASFAQGLTAPSTPAAPAAKVSAPAPA